MLLAGQPLSSDAELEGLVSELLTAQEENLVSSPPSTFDIAPWMSLQSGELIAYALESLPDLQCPYSITHQVTGYQTSAVREQLLAALKRQQIEQPKLVTAALFTQLQRWTEFPNEQQYMGGGMGGIGSARPKLDGSLLLAMLAMIPAAGQQLTAEQVLILKNFRAAFIESKPDLPEHDEILQRVDEVLESGAVNP